MAHADAIRRMLIPACALIAGGTFTACGNGTHDNVVVRVGHVAITQASVEHWMAITAGGRIPRDPTKRQALQQQTLNYLITSQWQLNEAAADHLELAQRGIDRQLAKDKKVAFPGGATERDEYLRTTGEAPADLAFEAKAELAATKIHQMLVSREPPITGAEVADYYNHHKLDFKTPEERTVVITNRKVRREAQAIVREVKAGRSFTSITQLQWVLTLPPITYSRSRGSDSTLLRAVHEARPHTLSGPVFQHVDYYLFEVTHVTPARQKTLLETQGTIKQQLAGQQRQRTLKSYDATWKHKWSIKTHCTRNYTTPQCGQGTTS